MQIRGQNLREEIWTLIQRPRELVKADFPVSVNVALFNERFTVLVVVLLATQAQNALHFPP